MSFIKIMIHCVWCTKRRAPVLVKKEFGQIIEYIRQSAVQNNIFTDCINGYTDHLHALISLGGKQNIADVMQQIKGGSSFWINNKTKLFIDKFEWADKYYAVSVSESQIAAVRNYIHNQEKHHEHKTFLQEYEEFLEKYSFGELG